MRLTSLRLRRYGPFADLPLTLHPTRLNLICAPNGAGKSVLRQAFADLLFGIHTQSKMNFRFPATAAMHLAATAIGRDGTPFAFGRRKGMGNTLTDADGAPSDAISLATHLAATDRGGLERLFAMDTAILRAGERDLMATGGLIANALLAGGGLGAVRDIRRALEAEADALAPARKTAQRPFYAAADRFVVARRQAADALLKPDDWARQAAAITQAEAALGAARATAAAAGAAMNRLQTLRRVRPAIAALDAAQAWLGAHPDAPVLPAGLGARLDETAANLRAATEKLRAETLRRDALAAELAAIPQDSALLAQATAIDLLAEQAGAAAKALEDLPARAAELAQIETRIAQRLRSLGAPPGAEAATLIPPRAVASATRALIRGHGTHEGACRQATRTRDDLTRKIAALRAGPAHAAADTAALGALIEEIRAHGDPAAAARDAAARAAAAQAALARALSDIPFWSGPRAALEAIALPAAPLLEAAYARLTAAEAALQRDATAADATAARHDTAQARLREATAGGIVPDRDAVAAARRHRQALWDLIARTAFGPALPGQTPPGADELAILDGQTLPLAFERATLAADTLADRRADETTLVERARATAQQAAEAADAHATAQDRHAASERAAAEAAAVWAALLPAPLPAVARLDDVRAFAAARGRALEHVQAAALAHDAAVALAARHDAWAARLRVALSDAADPALAADAAPAATPEVLPASSADSLPALLQAAIARIAEAAMAEKHAAALAATTRELHDQHGAAEAICRQADADRHAWQADWAASLAALGRPAGEAPGTTEEILGLLADLDADLTQAAGLATRIAGMKADNARFSAGVAGLAAALASSPAPAADAGHDTQAALAVLRSLRRDATAAQQNHSKRQTLTDQHGQADRHAIELTRALALRRQDVDASLRAIGATTETEAAELLDLAAQRARHEAEAARATTALLQEADGQPLETLRAQLAALTAGGGAPSAGDQSGEGAAAGAEDAPTADLAAILYAAEYTAEAEASAARAEAEQHVEALALLRRALAEREAATAYADAIQAQNAAAAEAGTALRQATIARLAATLLGGAMEAVEEQASPAMLKAIGRWFARLTDGAYPAIGLDPGQEGAALLLTQAAFPDEPRRVGELSEGTRDQLFLALRLAAIESHSAALPFVADDILQTFDDARALAALQTLQDLCGATQVILLTHHRHILELAARLPGDAVHVCSLETI